MKPQYLIQLVRVVDNQQKLIWCKTLEELHTFLAHVDNDTYVVGDITATEINPEWKDYCKQDTKLEHGGIHND